MQKVPVHQLLFIFRHFRMRLGYVPFLLYVAIEGDGDRSILINLIVRIFGGYSTRLPRWLVAGFPVGTYVGCVQWYIGCRRWFLEWFIHVCLWCNVRTRVGLTGIILVVKAMAG